MDEDRGRIRIRRGGEARPLLRRWYIRLLLALAGLVLVAWLVVWLVFARDLPSPDKLMAYEPPLPTNIRSYDGAPVYTYARERRIELGYDEFPPLLVDAFVSAEDKTFFTHHGVDLPGFAAAVIDYAKKYGSGVRARGGSTITQQVAKNLLTGNEYSVRRKVREAILAIRIENTLSKQQIMEIYLNQIFLGRNAYGVEAAAQAYFGKDVRDLTLPEMAYLAILPKAPSNYTPEHDGTRALERRAYVLREMVANGHITAAQGAQANDQPLGTIGRQAPRQQMAANYFTEEVRRELLAKYGENADDGPYSVYAGGLWVRTSYDPRTQEAAAKALRDGLLRYDAGRGWPGRSAQIDPGEGWQGRLIAANVGAGIDGWRPAVVLAKHGGAAELGFENGSTGTLPSWAASMPKRGVGGAAFNFLKPGDVVIVASAGGGSYALHAIPVISGGFVAEDPHTGQVLALQGGWDFKGNSFDRATQALRQPGSSFKPFVYSAALDSGMTPASIIVDGPFCVYQSALLGSKCFRNFSGGYAGPHTMRWGVEQSRNLMTVRAASQTGMKKVVELAKRVGIGDYPPMLAISLGAGDTTVLRMVSGFATIDNQGRKIGPTTIDYVQDRRGKVIWRADERPCEGCDAPDWDGRPMPRPPVRGRQVIDPLTAYQVLHILEGVVQRGTATVLRDLSRPLFGKTGTNTGPTNVWFVGGSADLVGGVYVGYDHPRPLGGYAQGGTIAAPIFKQFAQQAMTGMPVVPFRAPAGIRMVRIDRASGRRVYGGWPTSDPKSAIIWEAFKPESEPKRTIQRGPATATRAAPENAGPRDSEFLAREGGIY